jgi:hypothetical protein
MTTRFRILAVLLLLIIGVAGSALAQGFGDEDGGYPPTQSQTAPTAQVQQAYADGKVVVIVQTMRPYGYRIGEPVTVQVIIISDPSVSINTDGLERGNFDPVNGSDMLLVAPPVVKRSTQQGKNVLEINLQLKTFKTNPSVTWNARFMYAVDKLPNGDPNWQPVTTPDFTVSNSNTAIDASKDLDPGDLDQKSSPHPTPVLPMRLMGLVLLLIAACAYLGVLYRRLNPPKQLPANERAWRVFDRVLQESDAGAGVSYARAEKLAAALRAYLGVETIPTDKARPVLEQLFVKSEQRFELTRVALEALTTLDKALYERPEDDSKIALTRQQCRDLFARIERVVPRPE